MYKLGEDISLERILHKEFNLSLTIIVGERHPTKRVGSFLPMRWATSSLLIMAQGKIIVSLVMGSSSYSSMIEASVSLILFATHARPHLGDDPTVL